MDGDLKTLSLQALQRLSETEMHRLTAQLLEGASWEETIAQRQRIVDNVSNEEQKIDYGRCTPSYNRGSRPAMYRRFSKRD